MSGYRINEDDIARVVRYLETRRPEKANRGYAIQLLGVLHDAAKNIASIDSDLMSDLEDLLESGNNSGDEVESEPPGEVRSNVDSDRRG